MDVVGEQQQRLARREVHHQPVQSLQRREDTLLSARVAAPSGKHGRGGLRPARQQLGIVGDLALKKLAHHPERESAVQLRPPGAQNAQPFGLAKLPSGPEKLGLADTGLALDDKQPHPHRRVRARPARPSAPARHHAPEDRYRRVPQAKPSGLTLSQKRRAEKPSAPERRAARELAPGAPASPQKAPYRAARARRAAGATSARERACRRSPHAAAHERAARVAPGLVQVGPAGSSPSFGHSISSSSSRGMRWPGASASSFTRLPRRGTVAGQTLERPSSRTSSCRMQGRAHLHDQSSLPAQTRFRTSPDGVGPAYAIDGESLPLVRAATG